MCYSVLRPPRTYHGPRLIAKGAYDSQDDGSDDIGSDIWAGETEEHMARPEPDMADSFEQWKIAERNKAIYNWLSEVPSVATYPLE
jgi:hypothetical protein